MKNKKKIIAGAIAGALAVLTVGSFALFSDFDSKSVNGAGGTVNLSLSTVTLENAQNINPGDEDLDAPKEYVPEPGDPLYNPDDPDSPVDIPTTNHDLTFSVSNNGTKSVRTRQTILIKITKGDETLNPDAFYLADDSRAVEISDWDQVSKSYVDADGNEVSSPEEAEAIKYVIISDVFDGLNNPGEFGDNAEVEDAATVKEDNGEVTKQYTYALAMAKNSKNIYQDAIVDIDVVVEAMQFRNTTGDDWQVISTEHVSGSTGIAVDAVPEADAP